MTEADKEALKGTLGGCALATGGCLLFVIILMSIAALFGAGVGVFIKAIKWIV